MNTQVPESGPGDPEANLDLARRIRQATLATEGVAAISAGLVGEIATRFVGETVVGVAVDPSRVEVHVVAHYPSGFPIADLAERLRGNLEPLAGDRRLDVVVDDLVVDQDHAVT